MPTALNGLATDDEAQTVDEGEVGASTLGNGGENDGGRPSGSDSDSRFVCIDNNDNVVVEGEEPISELCKECYAANSRLQTAIEDFLVEFDFNVIISIGDGESIAIGPVTDTIEELCFQIENSAKIFGVPLSSGLLKAFLLELLEENRF